VRRFWQKRKSQPESYRYFLWYSYTGFVAVIYSCVYNILAYNKINLEARRLIYIETIAQNKI
jgi:hypothetical protein